MGKLDDTGNLMNAVNSSGFLFQLRVQTEVEATASKHGWTVFAQEHPWADTGTGKSGYIDLVLSQDIMRMVVECKRTQNANWIFLIPDNAHGSQMRSIWARAMDVQKYRTGAHDFHPEPESPISEFCIVRGTGEDHSPMLERLSGILLDSSESLAAEEVLLSSHYGGGANYIYFPVIVTNAQLYVCRFDMKNVSIDEGKLSGGDFESVPYIRFRKSLTTKLTESAAPQSVHGANKNRVRTILVVQAGSLTSLLQEWRLELNALNQPFW